MLSGCVESFPSPVDLFLSQRSRAVSSMSEETRRPFWTSFKRGDWCVYLCHKMYRTRAASWWRSSRAPAGSLKLLLLIVVIRVKRQFNNER